MAAPKPGRVIGAVNLGSFRVSALVAQVGEGGASFSSNSLMR